MKGKRWLCILLSIAMILMSAVHVPAVSAAEQTSAQVPAVAAPAEEADIFSRVWNQMTEEILTVYELYRIIPTAPQSTTVRLKLEPDTLNLLNLLSNTLLGLDIGWVNEIGVDVMMDIPELPETVSPYQFYGSIPSDPSAMDISVKDVPVPSLTALLHINGQEIAAADAWADPNRRAAYVALPGLVSGQLATTLDRVLDRDALNSFFISYALNMYKEDLFPPAELLRKILEIPGSTPGVYEPVSQENGRLEAGSVSQECTAYTGKISLQNAAGLLQVLLEKAGSDQEFQEMIRTYLDGSLWKSYQEKMAVQTVLDQLARQFFYTSSLERAVDETYVRMAVQRGEWEYLKDREELIEKEQRQREQKEAEKAEETEDAADDVPAEAEPPFGYWNLGVEPGQTLTTEEMEELPGETVRFMLQAWWNKEIGLTRDYQPSDIIFYLLNEYHDTLSVYLQELIASVPENVSLEPVFRLDREGDLIGLSLAAADPVGNRFPILDVGSAVERDDQALDLRIGGESGMEILVENLALPSSAGRELHFNLDGKEMFPASGEGRMTIREDGLQMDLHLIQEGELLLSAEGTYLTDGCEADFEIRLPSSGGMDNSIRLNGSLDPETQKGHYVLHLNGVLGYQYGIPARALSPEIRIDTEQIAGDDSGGLQGKIAFSLGNWPDNLIPEGMKLVLDLGRQQIQLADDSAVYASLQIMEPAYETMTEAAARIRERNDPAYFAASAYRSSFGKNWNVTMVLNRLMQAGMPEDLLGDTSLPQLQKDLNALPDLLDELGGAF